MLLILLHFLINIYIEIVANITGGTQMIEHLSGIHETIDYKGNTNLRLFDNIDAEDYPAHWHTSIEIIMPIESGYTVIVGNSTIELNESDIIFIAPGVVHTLKAPVTGRRIIFQAELTAFRELKQFESLLNLVSPTLTITSSHMPKLHELLHAALLDIMEEYNSDHPYIELAIYTKLLDMFVALGRVDTLRPDSLDSMPQMQKEYIDRFVHICNYITEHCTEDLTLDEVANLAGFSKYHFTRLFKQFTNVTFYKYLTQKRIAHAEELLINQDLPVTEVALQSGFSNQSAFIRMFKLIKSSTPTEYRAMYSKANSNSLSLPY